VIPDSHSTNFDSGFAKRQLQFATRAPMIAHPAMPPPAADPVSTWTFFTNHGHVLLLLAREPEQVLRDVAIRVGITERAVQRIIGELEAAGYLTRERDGRRNRYEVHLERPLRHPIEAPATVGEIFGVLTRKKRK